ncbi:hypothetical protein C7974DRAFT_187653 [Boeremia exigua]|uniref:uncharacterized protein n=1 Tax=Boeremia exigua TaxID=749465 RepID=UPI001E8CDA9C|nr:uncharacterized protein C7974DRAFT_187653 [Boeremia exigua]KAH6629487.1 hypothetical protein C7974DRAFT_187653 [Boeremia exigua]
MSTAVLGMQSLGPRRRNTQLDLNAISNTAAMYGTADNWASSTQEGHAYVPISDYTAFPVARSQQSDIQFTLQSGFGSSGSNDRTKLALEPFLSDYKTQSDNDAPLEVPTTTGMYTSPAMFTASNSQIIPHDPSTVSPMDTNFDVDYASPRSDTKPLSHGQTRNITPSAFAMYANDTNSPSSKRRCDSLQSNLESHSSNITQAQVGRRRGSEYAEPGSARAVYLEKNRKAASKCRGKQKRQQEELVERAREVERRNKVLKVEVEMLRSGLRDLMDLVGQHANCPDSRLKTYVQREADRLAHGEQRHPLATPFSGCSFSGPPSTDDD